MKYYKFHIYDEPKRREYYRFGKLKKIVYKNGDEFSGEYISTLQNGRQFSEEELDKIEKIVIETHFQKKEKELYPNFMQIRWSFYSADNDARGFLDQENITYKTLPLEVVNEINHTFKIILFEKVADLLDLKASNLYLTEEGTVKTVGKDYLNTVLSKTVLKSKVLSLRGIFRLKERFEVICDEETKKALENSGLTGFNFEELEVSGN